MPLRAAFGSSPRRRLAPPTLARPGGMPTGPFPADYSCYSAILMSRGETFSGKTVAVLFPAWHSCGTYRVVLGQISAYRSLGARVLPIAVSTDPGYIPERAWIWRPYVNATPELNHDERYFCGASFLSVLRPNFLKNVLWPYLHGDQAKIRTGLISLAKLPRFVESAKIDLVHCNHFFIMPAARKIAKGKTPIILESHDVQARQFSLMNEGSVSLCPKTTYDDLLRQEIEEMRSADLLLHLNADENEEFRSLLPSSSHALLYPSVPSVPTRPSGNDILIVASNNAANVQSLIWFLREVAPKLSGISVKVVGNVVDGVRERAAGEFELRKEWFVGRVADLNSVYQSSRLILLPAISGHGLSIKAVEAMASGLPIIATRHAFRGMEKDASHIGGITIVDSSEEFAEALALANKDNRVPRDLDRQNSPTRRYYEEHFSLTGYTNNLARLVAEYV
jgi:polysaccharide biosynthesis protein PslH